MPNRRALLIAVSAAAAGLCAAAVHVFSGVSGTDGTVAVPVPDPRVAAYCRALDAQLPARLNGLARHDPGPDSHLTAAWGNPRIVLRCGVPRPAADADPATPGAEVGGVSWSFEEVGGGRVRLTTTLRKAYVELTLPARYAHDAAPLLDLAGPVKHTIPEGI